MKRPYQRRPFVPEMATLWPHMLLPRISPVTTPYPFKDPKTRYYHYARNGIYAMARLWNLAGQEVLFPSYFHGVELDALVAAGLQPRFYPVRDRMRIEVADIVTRISPQTRAVYLIHYLGFPGPVEELANICRESNVFLFEDCALALFSSLGNTPLGSFGDAAFFCIYKTLPLPHGGALVLRRGEPSELPKSRAPSLFSTFAHAAHLLDRNFEFRGKSRTRLLLKGVRALAKPVSRSARRQVVPIGVPHFDPAYADLAMSRFCHLVLAAQDFPSIVEKRRRNYLQLLERLRKISPPIFDELPPGVCPLFYPFQTQAREALLERLLARGVEAGGYWSRQHPALPLGTFPEADNLRRTVLGLPCHQDLTPELIDWVADQVCKAMREIN